MMGRGSAEVCQSLQGAPYGNLLYLLRIGNNGEYFHGRAAFDTLEWIYLVYLGNPHPKVGTFGGRDLPATVSMQLCSQMSRESNQGGILVVFQANRENRGAYASTHPEPAVQHRASRSICPDCVRSTSRSVDRLSTSPARKPD